MPELPEVETVRKVLKKQILNKEIEDVIIYYPKMLDNKGEEFRKILKKNKFINIDRKGKWLIFELENHYLLSHLRMEGKFFIKNSNEEHLKHEHIIIRFTDKTDLRYHDVRKFGRMKVIEKDKLNDTIEIKKQGKEPFDKDLESKYLLEKFKDKKIPIKTTLLNQEIISGLGNIYADEVLFASGIYPLRETSKVTKGECDKIIRASKEILTKAIKEGGTTIRSYTSSLGVSGNYQNYLSVHKKEGKPCGKCRFIIKKIKVNGRSTYYCPNCQK